MELSTKLTAKLNALDTDTKIRLYYRLKLKDLNISLNEILMFLVEGKRQDASTRSLNTDTIVTNLVDDGSINYYRRYILHNLYDDVSIDSARYKNLVTKLSLSYQRAYDYFDAYTLRAYCVYYKKLVNLLRSSSPTRHEICYIADVAKDYTLNSYLLDEKAGTKFHQFDFGTTELLKLPKEINKENRNDVMQYLTQSILIDLGIKQRKNNADKTNLL